AQRIPARARILEGVPTHHRICGHLTGALPADRLSGRLLHLAPYPAHEVPAAGSPRAAILGQLSDAHAGLGQSFCARRLRERVAEMVASGHDATRLAER